MTALPGTTQQVPTLETVGRTVFHLFHVPPGEPTALYYVITALQPCILLSVHKQLEHEL